MWGDALHFVIGPGYGPEIYTPPIRTSCGFCFQRSFLKVESIPSGAVPITELSFAIWARRHSPDDRERVREELKRCELSFIKFNQCVSFFVFLSRILLSSFIGLLSYPGRIEPEEGLG